jgi:uncharacterized membrane protein YeaQ/YmgE (transglycosylase-associated protein family)
MLKYADCANSPKKSKKMSMDERYRWLVVALFAFLGGVVANICRPTRRGLIGFIASGVIGIFCGTTVALSSNLEAEQQIALAAFVAVFSDKILTWSLNLDFLDKQKNTWNTFNSTSQQNQIGDDNDQQ